MAVRDDRSKTDVDYWNSFYAKGIVKLGWPSQFATFVRGEVGQSVQIVDMGCGNGRDSFFFASQGLRTIGVDGAEAAINKCLSLKQQLGTTNVDFFNCFMKDPDIEDKIRSRLTDDEVVVYARFFIHALYDAEEEKFFKLARSLCGSKGLLAVEFRTIRDASLHKITPDHYRRFIEPAKLLHRAFEHGFSAHYYVEGFGFAKHGIDDAYVARCLLRLN